MSHSWLSAHIFYHDSLDDLLKVCIAPLLEQVLHEGLADSFFFIRYAENGLHVRLRLRAEEALHPQLANLITEACENYFSNGSLQQENLSNGSSVPYMTNSVQFIPYEPEIKRYGGSQTIGIAESFFNASSVAVMHWLQSQSAYELSQPLPTALLLHTLFAATCLDAQTVVRFFDRFTEEWLPQDPATELTRVEEQSYWRAIFDQRYEQYHERLVPFVLYYWHADLSEKTPDFNWLAAFREAVLQMHRQYCERIPNESRRLDIYCSLIHMTNNRLGVPNHDEAFLTYLLSRTLQQELEINGTLS